MIPRARAGIVRRHGIKFLVFAILLLISTGLSRAQWIQTSGPEGGYVGSLVVDGKYVFAGCIGGGGVFRSSNSGESWKRVNAGLTGTDIRALAVYRGCLYAGSATTGLFRSSDRGDSWHRVRIGTPDSMIQSLGVHSSSLFVQTWMDGTWRSVDSGEHWEHVRAGRGTTAFFSYRDRLFAGELIGLYVSSDNGAHWASSSDGIGQKGVFAFASIGDCVFAGTNRGISASSNGGALWNRRDTTLNDISVYALAAVGGTLYAGTSNGVFVSTDAGYTWDARTHGLHTRMILALTRSRRNLFAATGRGVYVSSDMGSTWVLRNRGFLAAQVMAFGGGAAHLLAGTMRAGIFSSSNRGRTWSEADSGLPESVSGCFADHDSTIYAALDPGGVYRTPDYGRSWTARNEGLADPNGHFPHSGIRAHALLARGKDLLVGTDQGIFRWLDSACSWGFLPRAFPESPNRSQVMGLACFGTSILAASARGLLRSTDEGLTWSIADTGLNVMFTRVAASDSHAYAGGFGFVVSSDHGRTWMRSGASQRRVWSIFAGREFILKGERASLQLSSDCGTTWVDVDEGLPPVIISALAVRERDVFAGTFGFGVWRRPVSDIVASAAVSVAGLDSVFGLRMGTRNMDQAHLELSYRLPCAMDVTLAVVDARGRRVLNSGVKREAKGNHGYAFDLTGCSRGIYVCRVQAGRFMVTRKLLYLGKGAI